MPTLYVDPAIGNNSAAGSQSAPLKNLTLALNKATSGTTIHLAAGTYNNASGEKFPLIVPSGVTVFGNEANKGSGILIEGSGEYISPTFARQNITILLQNQAQLKGVTVTNRATRGTAVWVESTSPTIANNTFINSNREGVFATGTANPMILDNVFTQNGGNGISFVKSAKGEVRRNVFQKTGYALSIGDKAAPLLTDNKIFENRCGIVLSGEAKPVLRKNTIEKNTEDGLTVIAKAMPDMGSSSDPGGNILRDNGQYDLQNATPTKIVSVGNLLNPKQVKGLVDFVTSQVPVPEPGTGTGGTQPGSGASKLTDIAGHWAAAFIQGMVDKGFISGFPDGSFKPEASLTRGQYAAIIAKTFNLTLKQQATKFSDVKEDFWALDAIVKANRMGFISGFPDGTFRPGQNLTRVQAIVSLVSGLGLTGGSQNALGYYGDRALIPSYATDEVATATQKRIVVNYPKVTELNPMRDITRAEVAALIYQALVSRGEAKAIASDYIVVASDVLPSSLSDIKDHWAEKFIVALFNAGLINGFPDSTFKPDNKMTRAEYAALLVKAFKPTAKRTGGSFKDVAETFWGAKAIGEAYKGEFVSGFPDNTFKPNDNVQRVQAIVSLVNGLGLTGGDAKALDKYEDSNAIPEYAKEEVAIATQKRLIVNYPSVKKLNPTQDATRAEVAAMVYQALVDAKLMFAINSSYIVSA